MHPVRFKPYIGVNYAAQDFKILILGESHYLKKENYDDFKDHKDGFELLTNEVVNRYLCYKRTKANFKRWMNTFTKFSNITSGKRLSNIETVDFWEKYSFYNYVQEPTTGPRISPSKEAFSNSINAFESIVKQTKPNLVFFWGQRLWRNFPKENYESIEFKNNKIDTLKIDYNLPIMRLPHPSSSKFNKKLTSLIKYDIDVIKGYWEHGM